MFLDDEEIVQLTGRKRRLGQSRALKFMGIEHRIRPDGSVAVSRAHVEQVLGVVIEGILLLDFDGVLHDVDVIVERNPDGKRFPTMRGPGELMQWVPILEAALTPYPDVQIVLSTQWVWWFGLEFCRSALPPTLAANVSGATWEGSENMPTGWIHLPRCEQIRLHVRRHKKEEWIALDDDGAGLPVEDQDRDQFVICDSEHGISDPDAINALIEQLRRE